MILSDRFRLYVCIFNIMSAFRATLCHLSFSSRLYFFKSHHILRISEMNIQTEYVRQNMSRLDHHKRPSTFIKKLLEYLIFNKYF